MLSYPIQLTKDTNDTLLVDFPDVPSLHTFGKDRDDALGRALDALKDYFWYAMRDREDIALPRRRRGVKDRVDVPAMVELKVRLYLMMREQGVNRAEMARRLHWNFERVARALNPHHDSKMGTMETAFGALGLEVDVQLKKAS